MPTRRRFLGLAAATLALSPFALSRAALVAGRDYALVEFPQPTLDPKRVEVLELFFYGCPHCFELEPLLSKWLKTLPRHAYFRRMPAVFHDGWVPLAKAYYALEALGLVDKLHAAIFDAIHLQGANLNKRENLLRFIAAQGVDAARFGTAYDSFAVQTKVQQARELTSAYGIQGVPSMIVDGRYRTSSSQTGGHERLFPVLDELIALAWRSGRANALPEAKPMTIRVILVDDHPLFRKGLEHLVANEPGLALVGQFASVEETRAWLKAGGTADVALLDRRLPGEDGLSLVPDLKQANIRVVMLTIADAEYEIRDAIERGVDGYILKSSEPEQILQAIRSVHAGNSMLPAEIMQKMARGELAGSPFDKLSPRELEIVAHVARGMSNRAIGQALNLSENTVRNHLRNILDKLKLANRVQVATLALELGLVRRAESGAKKS
jgi:DNA-binding NarL/FixJ family response regulator/protein-disulfide isomerase